MKLIKLQMKNFRQFYGIQPPIEFANGNKNVTIIMGQNGRGKTGIFRALMFGLFGLLKLPQDDPLVRVSLVNSNAITEAHGKLVTSEVSVMFEHNNSIYTISRTIKGTRIQTKRVEKTSDARLTVVSQNSGIETIYTNAKEIDFEISKVIDIRIKDFFLFDGEKIDTFTKTNKESREEIKNAIIKLLQIENIEKGLHYITNIYDELERDIVKKTKNNLLTEAKQNLDCEKTNKLELVTNKSKLQNEYDLLRDEITIITTRINELSSENALIEKLMEQKKLKENEQKLINSRKESLKNNFFKDSVNYILLNSYSNTKEIISNLQLHQKDSISLSILQEIEHNEKCICGQVVEKHSIYMENIKKLQRSFVSTKVTPFIYLLNYGLAEIDDDINLDSKTIENLFKKISQSKTIMNNINKNIDYYTELINDPSSNELNSLKKLKIDNEDKATELYKKISSLEDDIKISNIEIEELKRKYEYLLGMYIDSEEEIKELNKLGELRENFNNLLSSYTEEMRKKLELETNNNIKNLLPNDDSNTIKHMFINDKYEFDIINWKDESFTQDFSQGQRQIISLSFITALIKIAGFNSSNVEFPLFVDTPFGRIDSINRKKLINYIPDSISQWIVLSTDTEIKKEEEDEFDKSNKLGYKYKIVKVKEGYSEVKKVALNEKLSKRS